MIRSSIPRECCFIISFLHRFKIKRTVVEVPNVEAAEGI